MLSIKETEDGITFAVKVLPRSSRCEIAGIQEDALKLKITAPPVEGLANEECIRFLAKLLHVGKSNIRIIGGGAIEKKSASHCRNDEKGVRSKASERKSLNSTASLTPGGLLNRGHLSVFLIKSRVVFLSLHQVLLPKSCKVRLEEMILD